MPTPVTVTITVWDERTIPALLAKIENDARVLDVDRIDQ